MKITIILGTRPEIIKLSSIIRYCEENKLDYYIIHTNQHYSPELDSIFFQELKLPSPKYNLNTGPGTQGEQLGKMLKGIENVFLKDLPDVAIVQGDTNSVFAGALMASRFGVKLTHVEAGLRSYDRNMPEEINRLMTDAISDYFFCPTEKQKSILVNEGVSSDKILVTGNTVVDAVYWAKENETDILDKNNLIKRGYCLLTMHRAENVDDKERIKFLLSQIGSLAEEMLIFPIHPRTKKMIEMYSLELPKNIVAIDPVGFLDMITLEKNAKIILTDSGGIQEEACILKIPCITLRTTTERPESIDVGGNMLMTDELKNDFDKIISVRRNWDNPFGNNGVARKIIENILIKS